MRLPKNKLESLTNDHANRGTDRTYLAFRRGNLRAYASDSSAAGILVVYGPYPDGLEQAMRDRCVSLTRAQFKALRETAFELSVVKDEAVITMADGMAMKLPLEDARLVDNLERCLADAKPELPKLAINPKLLLDALKAIGSKSELIHIAIDSDVLVLENLGDLALVAPCAQSDEFEAMVKAMKASKHSGSAA